MNKQHGYISDYLFAHMTSMFGHSWTSAYGEDPRSVAGVEWAQALIGVTREQIDAGLSATRLSGEEWPPSAPKFLERCLGVPPIFVLSYEIRAGDALSAFAYAVMQDLDIFAWRQSNTERADRLLREAYERVRIRVMAREPLPQPPVAYIVEERPEVKLATAEHRERCFAEIRASLGMPQHAPAE